MYLSLIGGYSNRDAGLPALGSKLKSRLMLHNTFVFFV